MANPTDNNTLQATTHHSDSNSDSDIPSIHAESDSDSQSGSESDSNDYTQGDRLAAFLRRDDLEEAIALPRKRPRKAPAEAPYEKQPRRAAKSTSEWNAKPIATPLPVKSPDGTLSCIAKRPIPTPDTSKPPEPDQNEKKNERLADDCDHVERRQLTKTEQRRRKAAEESRAYALLDKAGVAARTRRLKAEMAVLGRKLVSHPESAVHGTMEHPSCRRQLLDLTKDMNGTVRKFALLSLLAAFKDMIPGYKIRLPTAEERRMRLKKEVRLLRRFERELLEGYHAYVQLLQRVLQEEDVGGRMFALATKAACVLLAEKSHFNLREHLLALVVPLMNCSSVAVAEECRACVRQLLKDDPNGEITLEVITQISRLVRSKGEQVKADVIRVTFQAKLVADLKDLQRAKQAKVVKKVRKRRRKKGDEVGLGLQEAAATEDPALKHARQAESLRELFVMYLRVLKRLPKSGMLPSVLEGIAKFLHLLNLDLVQALSSVLSQRVRNNEFPIPSALQAIKTMLTLMQGPGRELRLEDTVYLAALLQLIGKLRATASRDEYVPRLIECLEVAFLRKNQQRAKHVPVFICELASLGKLATLPCFSCRLSDVPTALHLAPHGSLAVVAGKAVIGFVQNGNRSCSDSGVDLPVRTSHGLFV